MSATPTLAAGIHSETEPRFLRFPLAERRMPDPPAPDTARDTGRPAGDEAGAQSSKEKSGEKKSGGGGEPPRPSFLRRHPVRVFLAFLVIVASAIGGYLYWQHTKQFEHTDDAFVDARPFALAPKVSGYVTEVFVDDNQHIDAGATVLRIDPRDYRISLEQAEAQAEAARAQIAIYDAQIVGQAAQIEQSQAQVAQAEAALEFADKDFKRYQELAQKGAGTIQRSQQSTSDQQQRQADLARAKAALTGARQQVDVLKAQRRNAEASLAQMRAQVDQAQLNLSYTTVTTLQGGKVAKLSAAVGQYAQAGTSAMMLVPDRIWVTANFKETQLTDMRPGQPVELTIDAYSDHKIEGRVDSIQSGSGTAFSLLPAENATGNYVKVVQRVPVKIVVERWPPDVAIGPGMSVVPRVRVR